MRIRKLLGCASDLHKAPSPLAPRVAAVPVASADVMENANEDDEEGTHGVVKSGFEAVEKEEDGVEENMKDKEENKDEKAQAGRGEKISEEVHSVTKCKKTDGKGWRCKRASQHPHSLCNYHLAQLRSYRSRFEDQVSRGSGNRRRKSAAAAMEAGREVSDYHYYYSILSPEWGKRKASADDKTDHGAVLADNEEYEIDGGGRSSGRFSCNERRAEKKRCRKPVKARSLKSIL